MLLFKKGEIKNSLMLNPKRNSFSFFILSLLILFLFLPVRAEAKRVDVYNVEDLRKVKDVNGIRYIVKATIDLDGETILLAPNSKLCFQNGSFSNGTIEGNQTRIETTKENVFHNCQIGGIWLLDRSYSSMFDKELDAVSLLQNLSCLSSNVYLFPNRRYIIQTEAKEIALNTLAAASKEKPVLEFMTIDPNKSGIILVGDEITISKIIIKDDYESKIDLLGSKNKATIGNTIEVKPRHKKENTLLIENCDFTGGTSSSYIASSSSRQCYVKDCTFSGYMADHAVYCSMCIETFSVQDCKIDNVSHTRGVFKIRSSDRVRKFSIKNTSVNNLNGYMAVVGLKETPDSKILLDHINVTKDNDFKGIFYGFCIYDETRSMEALDRYNVGEIIISNCKNDYGYNGEPVIYPGSENKVCARKISYNNNIQNESNFGGGITNLLSVKNSTFRNCCSTSGIEISAKDVSLDGVSLEDDRQTVNSLFLINYNHNKTKSILLRRVNAKMNVKNMFKVFNGNEVQVAIERSDITLLSNSLVQKRSGVNCTYRVRKLTQRRGSEYKLFEQF